MNLNRTQRRRAFFVGLGSLATGDLECARPCFRAAFTGQWEGWEQSRLRDRPGMRMASQDTDLNYGVRESMNSESRSLEQTFPIAKRIKNQYADYCVGRCNIRWDTGNPAIDLQYRKAWQNWMNVCDYRAKHRFPKLMKLAVGQAFAEGDMFIQLVDSNGFSQINLIEGDRVTSSGIFNFDTDEMVGGIGLDPLTRRHKFIRVWQRTIYGTFINPVEIPASDYVHLFDTARVDAERGLTAYHCVLNALRDMKEISAAELAKTKRNSKLAIIAKTITGQAAPPVDLFGGGGTQPPACGKFSVERIDAATTAYMFPSESMEAHESNSPGQSWQGHMEFIVRNIALGANLPFGVVWNMAGLNKPAVLFELQQAARTIAAFQDQLEDRAIRPIAGWWLAKEIKYGRLPFTPNWFNFSIGRPPYISIDAGRDSIAAINENKMGMRSLAKWYDETDDYWEDEINQCVRERKFLEDACKAAGVDPNNVRMMNANPAGQSEPATKDPGGAE